MEPALAEVSESPASFRSARQAAAGGQSRDLARRAGLALATAQVALAASRGHRPERIEVMPTLGNVLVWRALYEHGGKIHADRIRVGLAGDATVRGGWALATVGAEELTAAERARDRRRSFARFAWFSEDWVARTGARP